MPGRYLLTTPSSSTVNGNFGPIFTNLLPLGRRGRHCVRVLFLATVGWAETLVIKTLSVLPTSCAVIMDPSLIHPAPPEAQAAERQAGIQDLVHPRPAQPPLLARRQTPELSEGIGRYVATTNNLRRRGRGSGGVTRIVSAICWI